MHKSVLDHFVGFSTRFEGRVPWMYVDIKGFVTVGIGNLIDPKPMALGLPFVDKVTGSLAGPDAIAAEWDLLKSQKDDLARRGHRACEPITRLRLPDAAIDALVATKLLANEVILKQFFPAFDGFPADAQLGMHSMAWALGPAFSPQWPRFTAAVRANDWVAAAADCRMREAGNPGVKPRNDANELLFRNAAAAIRQGLGIEVLHYPNVVGTNGDGTDEHGRRRAMSTLWFINGGDCVVTNANDESLYAGRLGDILPGVVGTIFEDGTDTALQLDGGLVYLFSGDQYGRYNLSTNAMDEGYPLAIADYWPGTVGKPVSDRLTAASSYNLGVNWYLYAGTEICTYDVGLDAAGPMQVVSSSFVGIPEGTWISAAVSTASALYLFAGDVYYRLTDGSSVDEGYPLAIEDHWPALVGFAVGGGFNLRNNVINGVLELSPPPRPVDNGLASTPARALTLDQARQILQELHDTGALTLAANPRPAWVNLAEPTIHGVEFRYWNGTQTQRSALRNLDPRNAVGLARLAYWLSSSYGAHTVSHIGINGDDTGGRTDCHGQGRAVDFAGVAGTFHGVDYDLNVLRDWGKKSVPNEANPPGPRLPQWPAGNRQLSYRLANNPDSSQLATEVFQAIYNFVAGEWQDGNDQPIGVEPISVIGHRSFVMNPDHPSSNPAGKNGREAHANHLHFQIGKTGTQ